MSPMAAHAISPGGWLAYVRADGRHVGRAHLDAEPHEQRFPPLEMLPDYRAAALGFHGERLLVGGQCGKEGVGFFDFDDLSPTWQSVKASASWRRVKKVINALLVDGDRLIAIDNREARKSLQTFDLAGPSPSRRWARWLRSHGDQEQVIHAALGTTWLALLIHTVDPYAGPFDHVAFLDRTTLVEYGNASCLRAVRNRGRPAAYWSAVAFQ